MDPTFVLCILAVAGIVACIPLTFHAVEEKEGYRAAVYEHAVYIPWNSLLFPVPRQLAVWDMMKNIRVYEEQTTIAAKEGADIIVFPEDGIYGMVFRRDTIKPFLEEIPDPKEVTWNPCTLPNNFTDIDIQRKLSCMARDNSIYVVANMGDRKPCNHSSDPKCPDDGQYQFNTDVVFDPAGRLVARYHKRNLFKEGQFDTPDLELVTFNTSFGTFGLFTCFDILFYQPAVELVRNYNIRNMVFPTAWMDELPYLAAIEFHSAFARGLGVNVLCANIHFPLYKFHGSGIYTPNGPVNYYYNGDILSGGKLLLSNVDYGPTDVTVSKEQSEFVKSMTKTLKPSLQQIDNKNKTFGSFKMFLTQITSTFKSLRNLNLDTTPRVVLPRENYTFVPLASTTGTKHACREDVCCEVVYSKVSSSVPSDLYVLAAFKGFDDGRFTEVCSVLRCPDRTIQTCGDPVRSSDTMFDSLELSGNFSTPFIFPEVLVSNENYIGIVQGEWTYSEGLLRAGKGFSKPLLTASLFAREYSKDNVTNSREK